MILLRRRVNSLLLHPPSPLPAAHTSPHFSLLRLLSTATTAPVSPKPFAAADYLVATCGLTRAQALKASKRISHLKSPSKPDAVVAFLSGIGASRSDIAAAIVTDPSLLCASVERTLARRVADISDLSLSPSQIARVLSLRRTGALRDNLLFWLPVFGSLHRLLQAASFNAKLLSVDLDKVAKPNLAFLQQCGTSACDIARVTLYSPILFSMRFELLQDNVARVEELGVPRGSPMFRRALSIVSSMSKEDVATKLRLLVELGWSRGDALVIVRKAPCVLVSSEEKIRRVVRFLVSDVGLEKQYFVQRPVLILYSLERRLMPRHCLIKLLRAKGLLNVQLDFYSTAAMAEKKFVQKFVHPYEDHIPGLVDAYTSSCSGEAPMRLIGM